MHYRDDSMDACSVVFAPVDDQRLLVVSPASGRPRADLVFAHGLSDHAARHLVTARWLAGRGYRTILFDLAGHGGNPCPDRSRWVCDAYADTEDAAALVARFGRERRARGREIQALVRAQYARLARTGIREQLEQVAVAVRYAIGSGGGAPMFLGGHSMGALLAIETAWRLTAGPASPIAGAVLVAPALRPTANPDGWWMRRLTAVLWATHREPARLLRPVVKAALHLNVPIDTRWGSRWFSDLPDEVALFDIDPLVPHRLPSRYLSSIESQMADTARRGYRFPIDAVMLVPRHDGIANRDAAIRFAESVNAATGAARITLVHCDADAHEPLRSSARAQARAAIAEWLDRRTG
jgi:alpha-beta hydrolase superfamily lysophospholipase